MRILDLAITPNQSFSVTLEGNRWVITLKVAVGSMIADISLNEVEILRGIRVVAGTPLIPYKFLQGEGNFMFLTEGEQLPWWERFGVDQVLTYATKAEIDAFIAENQTTLPPGVSSVYQLFPTPLSENFSFNDEGTATTGWTTSNGMVASALSYLRLTKTAAGSNASANKAVTFTPSNADYIIYGKVRAQQATGVVSVVWLLNGSKEVSIWFGTTNGSSASTPGAISIVGTTGASTRNIAQVASGVAYDTQPVEFALQFDSKFTSLTCWFREADGRWKWKGRVACDWFDSTQISMLMTTASPAASWIEMDYLSLARPSVVLLSDSIGEGKTLFSPNRSLALTNDESTWMRHAPLYRNMRNNLVVNKGVGGNTSAQMLARVTDATGTGASVLIHHASSNDEAAGISQGARLANTQGIVSAFKATGGRVIVLNASYGTEAGSDNQPTPDLRDYMHSSWPQLVGSLTGVELFIDTMQAVKGDNNFLASAMAADGIHYNIAGHTAVGALIKSLEPS